MSTSATVPPRPDTPNAQRVTSSFRTSTLEALQRNALMHGTQSKTEVSLDDFINTSLPNLPMGLNIADVHRRMSTKVWKKFSSPPATNPDAEDTIFGHLTPLFNAMVKAAKASLRTKKGKEKMALDLEERWSLITEPKVTPNIKERCTTIKPDALFRRSNSKSFSYYDIALTAEFKKRGGIGDSLDVSHPSSFIP